MASHSFEAVCILSMVPIILPSECNKHISCLYTIPMLIFTTYAKISECICTENRNRFLIFILVVYGF